MRKYTVIWRADATNPILFFDGPFPTIAAAKAAVKSDGCSDIASNIRLTSAYLNGLEARLIIISGDFTCRLHAMWWENHWLTKPEIAAVLAARRKHEQDRRKRVQKARERNKKHDQV